MLSGGKRVRPVLCVASYMACRERELVDAGASTGSEAALPVVPSAVRRIACSLELIHAYSLMHDDLPCMDDAPLRRGRPTPHTVFGEVPTLRAAALLIPMAARTAWTGAVAAGLPVAEATRIVDTLLEGAGARGMVGGQWVDLASEGSAIDEADLTRLHGMKTGALLTAAAVLGGLAARADSTAITSLETYGQCIGLAFQIADDVLDRTADAQALGKEPSDLELEKSTYVSLLGPGGAMEKGRAEVAKARAALTAGGSRVRCSRCAGCLYSGARSVGGPYRDDWRTACAHRIGGTYERDASAAPARLTAHTWRDRQLPRVAGSTLPATVTEGAAST